MPSCPVQGYWAGCAREPQAGKGQWLKARIQHGPFVILIPPWQSPDHGQVCLLSEMTWARAGGSIPLLGSSKVSVGSGRDYPGDKGFSSLLHGLSHVQTPDLSLPPGWSLRPWSFVPHHAITCPKSFTSMSKICSSSEKAVKKNSRRKGTKQA